MKNEILLSLEENLNRSLENTEKRFAQIRAGRANPATLDGVMVDYYGNPTPLKQLATISVPEARQLLIKPFDKSTVPAIEKAILEANLGYTPGNDGEAVRISIPILTEERRKDLVKEVKELAEEGKISIRNNRKEALDQVAALDVSEDEQKRLEQEVQDLVNEYNKKTEEALKNKEEELMSI